MPRKPISIYDQKNGKSWLNFAEKDRNLADMHNAERKNYKMQVQDTYDPRFPSEQEIDFFPKPKYQENSSLSAGDFFTNGLKGIQAQRKKKRAKQMQRELLKPLTRSQTIYLNKIMKIRDLLKRKLEDVSQIYKHDSYGRLYNLCLEQIATRKWIFKDLYGYLIEQVNLLQG